MEYGLVERLRLCISWFQYIKWKDFEPTNGNFNYDYIEEVINRPGSSGRHIILGFTDWYGENEVSDGGPG